MIVHPAAYMGQWELNFANQQRTLMRMFSEAGVTRARKLTMDIGDAYAREYARRVKDVYASETDGTGRLAASFGYYEPGYLHAHYRRILGRSEEPSRPSDAIFYQETRGNVYTWVVGTTVPYASAIEMGFVRAGDGRQVFIPKFGRWVTLNNEFTWGGIHATERVAAELESDSNILDEIAAPALKEFANGFGA